MTTERAPIRLTASELEILEMLWREDAVTILQAQQALGLPIGYTTVQTRLNRLVKKGVVQKSARRPAHYSAAITREEVQRHDLDLLVRRVSRGRVAPLVAHLLNHEEVTPAELEQLKQLVAEAQRQASASPREEGQG